MDSKVVSLKCHHLFPEVRSPDLVLNVPETFFGNNLYIRIGADGAWRVSARLDGGWRVAVGNEVPSKLKGYKYKQKGKKYKAKKSKKYKTK
ncbi:MAG: hypothetical protein GY738_00055 [Pseudoalteromonas sp.]|nr:hypothetical protein [Pseudoalteromonas sp.]